MYIVITFEDSEEVSIRIKFNSRSYGDKNKI